MNFKPLENDRPFAKIAFQGFAGDGKTYTATNVAIGIHKLIGSKKPIAVFDTEKAFKALKPLFDKEQVPVVVDNESRSLASLNAAIKWCEDGGADVLLIDSITHVWESYLQAYATEKKRTRLQFEDWSVIKPKWKMDFSVPFVQAKVHIIFTGRAGYEYEDEKDENGKRQIYKSGIKMKAENETAFEPDILVLMEKEFDLISQKKEMFREATILKDRTTVIDGKIFRNPTFEDFYPAIKLLLDGTIRENTGGEIPDTFQDWENKFSQINRRRDTTISEIEGAFALMKLGTSKEDKNLKAAILRKIWNVMSIDKLHELRLDDLNAGLEKLKVFADRYNDYMDNCADNTTNPDIKHIAEMLDKVMNEKDAITEMFGENGETQKAVAK